MCHQTKKIDISKFRISKRNIIQMASNQWTETDGTINAVIREYAPEMFHQSGGLLRFINLDGSSVRIYIYHNPQTLGGYVTDNLTELRLFAWNHESYVQNDTVDWIVDHTRNPFDW